MGIPRRSALVGIGLALGVCAGLVGCVGTASGSATTSARAESTIPSGAPISTQAATPSARPPVSCGGLATVAEVSTALGAEAASSDQNSYAGGSIESMLQLGVIALRQAGGLHCSWTTAASQAQRSLTVQFLPDAESLWSQGDPGDTTLPAIPAWGDRAYGGCIEADGEYCIAEVLVGGVWIESVAYGVVGGLDEVATQIDTLNRMIVSRIVAAGPTGPSWTAPAHLAYSCDGLLASGTSIEGIRSLSPYPSSYRSVDSMTTKAIEQIGGIGCDWHGTPLPAGSIQVVILPGGAWSWPSSPPSSNSSITLSAVDGVGSAAFAGCFQSTECSVQFLMGTTRIGVYESGADHGQVSATAIAKRIAAQLG